MMNMGRYLVTGGAGFIGSHLVEALAAEGHAVRVLDDLSTGRSSNLPPGAELIVASVTDPAAVRDALDGVDGCFHLAAIASVELTRREWLRSHAVNLSGTITVLEEVKRLKIKHELQLPVVYASSAAVYGDLCQIPITEESRTRPMSAYGADKLGCELHAAVAGGLFGISTVGLRFFNIYGPRQDPSSPYSGVISVFCDRLSHGAEIEIHGDGQQVRDFVFVGDAVRALQSAMTAAKPEPGVVNICTGVGTTISQLGETIASICGTSFKPRHAQRRAGDVRLSTGDPRKARELLGFRATVSLREGLEQTLQSMA
jgi:UDP-glucose 4-epimerase